MDITNKPGAHESQIGNSVHEGIDRVATAARPAVERIATGAHAAVDRIASAAGHASEALGARSEQLKATQEKVMGNVRGYVREHPLATVGVALAAGYVLSRLLRSR
jgi:ElaB/YqjD/DUF883 family membrane-anchored ribosome-binding protein